MLPHCKELCRWCYVVLAYHWYILCEMEAKDSFVGDSSLLTLHGSGSYSLSKIRGLYARNQDLFQIIITLEYSLIIWSKLHRKEKWRELFKECSSMLVWILIFVPCSHKFGREYSDVKSKLIMESFKFSLVMGEYDFFVFLSIHKFYHQ